MKRKIALIAFIAATLSSLQASSIFSDNFDYPDGGIVANSAGVWENNSGSTLMDVTNQQLIITSLRAEDIGHHFSTLYTTNGPVAALYASFTMRCTFLPSLAGTYFAHFSGTNAFGSSSSPLGVSGFRARIWASTTNFAGVAGPGQFFLSIVNSGLGNATNAQWATPLDTNVTYTVVTKYVLATGQSTLWINPASESSPSITGTDLVPTDDYGTGAFPTNGPVNISHYGFRQASGEGDLIVDDLRIATTFNEVAGANTAPLISTISDQNTPMNTTSPTINFTVQDAETPAGSLALSKTSSNTTVVPLSGIVFGGSGTNRTLTITPAPGQQGSSLITIFVSDGVNTNSTAFLMTVGAPSISAIPNQLTYANQPVVGIPFTVGDTESQASSLIVSNTSSNPALIARGTLGGSGANRSLTLTPISNQTGVSTITVYVSDGINVTATSFVLSVSQKLGVLLSDSFSYTDFLQDTALYGATDSPWGQASGTNYDLLVINGAAQLASDRSEDLAANLAGGPFASDSGMVLYYGCTLYLTSLPDGLGNYFAHLKDSITGTAFRAKLFACTNNAAGGFYRVGIANSANNYDVQFASDLSLNQTNQVIVRYNSGTGETVLWVNPAEEASTSVAAQDPVLPATVGAMGLRQDSFMGTVYLDNLVVGTSFFDVWNNISLAPIPIHVQAGGGNVVVSWGNPAFHLQSTTTLNLPNSWSDVPNATSPYTNNLAATQRFFRLKH